MGLIWIVAAAGWGVAEATLFFFVPDVLLTYVVMRFGLRAGLRLSVVAAAAASITGIFMWLWARHDPEAARAVMLMIPAIGPDLLARAHDEVASNWPLHLFTGAMTGVPYKLYAVEAGAAHINPLLFALVSFPARLTRFVLTVLAAELWREILIKMRRLQWRYWGWGAAWTIVYAVYFLSRFLASWSAAPFHGGMETFR
jgi:membrane protein YqaA with SNARE-associated domain